MQHNLSQGDIKRAILSAKRTSMSDGWPILLEAIVAGVFVSKFFDNALAGLAGFILALVLLVHKYIGNIVSLVIAGFVCLYICEAIYKRVPRLDLALVAGLIVGFFVLAFHSYHVSAVREFLEHDKDEEDESEEKT